MSMFSSDGVVGSSFNNDVLEANPQDDASKLKLLEEVKTRAKGCLSSGNLPEAIRLYTKAVELTESNPAASAIIHANRSMVHSKMGNHAFGLDDAIVALEKDSSYIKGYYRKATALIGLEDFSGAKVALLAGLALKADDKDMVAMMDKIAQKETAAAGKSKSQSTGAKPAISAVPTPAAIKKPSASAVKSSSSSGGSNSSVVIDKEDAEDLKDMRGYKKTADGRTTTFFNRELDETAKSLIGDIAPKKLDAPAEAATAPTATAAGGSAWNSAGTYEERILTDWAVERLTEALSRISYNIDALEFAAPLQPLVSALKIDSAHVQVTEASGVQGHAQVAVARGKRKYLADLQADLKWTVTLAREEGAAWVIQGTVPVIDISADKEFEWQQAEVSMNPSANAAAGISAKEVGELVKHLIRAEKGPHCLYSATMGAVGTFCDDLKTK